MVKKKKAVLRCDLSDSDDNADGENDSHCLAFLSLWKIFSNLEIKNILKCSKFVYALLVKILLIKK